MQGHTDRFRLVHGVAAELGEFGVFFHALISPCVRDWIFFPCMFQNGLPAVADAASVFDPFPRPRGKVGMGAMLMSGQHIRQVINLPHPALLLPGEGSS